MPQSSLYNSMRDSDFHHSTSTGDRYAVEVVGLRVIFGRLTVLRDIDVAIAPGESIAVMGPNGAGKSTLLKCFVGIVRPVSGHIRRFGEATARARQMCRQIGYVGQENGLYAELTVLENLMFSGRMYGVSNVRDRAAALLAEAGIESQAHRPVGQLSQGMRQRLAIARALLHKPQLIVLDEPSSNLDASGCQWLEWLFERWRNAGQTVCFASHDAVQCHDLADRIIRLNAGQMVMIEDCRGSSTILRRSA